MKVLVTGAAGFIGAHVVQSLLERGDTVVGVDNINDYYDVALKYARLAWIAENPNSQAFRFVKLDVADQLGMQTLFAEEQFDKVVHLAAQAGVRYSIENPHAYISSNVVGFMNVLEGCRHNQVEHLVYASSSSVYGANEAMPFSVNDNVDHPVSLYAASKKANELMAHTYSHLYALPTTGLRFFTVYGPWGRPDMAPIKFTKAILADEPIQVFNYGNHRRDFTYIDDIVSGVIHTLDHTAQSNPNWQGSAPDPATSKAPWRVYNIGAQTPVQLLSFIETLEQAIGKVAQKELLPMQPGDVQDTFADVESLVKDVGYRPTIDVAEGVRRFVDWYKSYYRQ
ncbi:MAG TPA: capsular biosynthesis protein CpsI [Glaciecola sp.]|nr:NAD-dependent epimerase [Glaciecola sp.]HAQ48346.1 capsular biosynthesis protein CpsI [Glaciecola sp.]